MKRTRQPAQALVEFALLAPVLLLLAVAVWDGGGVLREQLILQEAARVGARVAATAYGTVPATQVAGAARTAGADLPLTAADPVVVDPIAGTVVVSHTHPLYTPILRQLWGNGSGQVVLQARAQFFVPTATIQPPSVPVPAPTAPCTFDIKIPALANNTGWFSPPFQLAARTQAGYFLGRIVMNWTTPLSTSMDLVLFAGNPFAGKSNPLSGPQAAPDKISGVLLIDKQASPTSELSVIATGAQITPGSAYTAYFYNYGNALPGSSVGTVSFLAAACP